MSVSPCSSSGPGTRPKGPHQWPRSETRWADHASGRISWGAIPPSATLAAWPRHGNDKGAHKTMSREGQSQLASWATPATALDPPSTFSQRLHRVQPATCESLFASTTPKGAIALWTCPLPQQAPGWPFSPGGLSEMQNIVLPSNSPRLVDPHLTMRLKSRAMSK